MSVLAQCTTIAEVIEAHAKRAPSAIAFQNSSGASVSFAEFNSRVHQLCDACHLAGMQKGQRAAILSRNRAEYVEVFGLAKAGIVVVPLNWRLTAGELLKLLHHSAPEILFVDDTYLSIVEELQSQLPFVRTFVSFGSVPPGFRSYEGFIGTGSDTSILPQVSSADTLCIIYTSGTTGEPKGVEITHAGALGNARASATVALGLREADRTLSVMPLFHAGGMWYHLFPSFASGCTTHILSEFEPETVLRTIAEQSITNVHLVPSMIGALLAHPSFTKFDLKTLRILFYAASSMPPDMLRLALRMLPDCDFVQCYGSTEAGVVSVLDAAAHRRAESPEWEHLLLSCGKQLPDCAIRIVTPGGDTANTRAIGEIEVDTPSRMARYWANPTATSAVWDGSFLKTGDLGYRDEEGFLYIVDRKNDMIVTGGENVFPNEVEGALYGDPNILEAAVFGVPDPRWVERVVAAVVLKDGANATTADLLQRLKSKLASYKCPKEIYIRSSLPKSAVGKVLRKELRHEYSAESGGNNG